MLFRSCRYAVLSTGNTRQRGTRGDHLGSGQRTYAVLWAGRAHGKESSCAVRGQEEHKAKRVSVPCGGKESTRQISTLCREMRPRAHGNDLNCAVICMEGSRQRGRRWLTPSDSITPCWVRKAHGKRFCRAGLRKDHGKVPLPTRNRPCAVCRAN